MASTVDATFQFDAGHRTLGFSAKKDDTIHGHNWKLHIVVEAEKLQDEYKSVFDATDIKNVVKPMLDEFHHAFIIWKKDPMYDDFMSLVKKYHLEDTVISVDFNPTVEGLCEYFYHRLKKELPIKGSVVKRVDLDNGAVLPLRSSYWE
jgi:6-pyruvoyltetrahydropterin/6-carboxytetrahydropterin synthase